MDFDEAANLGRDAGHVEIAHRSGHVTGGDGAVVVGGKATGDRVLEHPTLDPLRGGHLDEAFAGLEALADLERVEIEDGGNTCEERVPVDQFRTGGGGGPG